MEDKPSSLLGNGRAGPESLSSENLDEIISSLESEACEARKKERGFAFWLKKGRLGDARVQQA